LQTTSRTIVRDRSDVAACPDVVEDMLAFVDERVPKLTTVVRSPVCAPDGSILTEEGYHGQSGLYLALGGMRVPPVSASPSESEIRRACHLLLEEYLGDFPFVSPADRAHALSPGLTTLAWHMIDGPTPLHLNEWELSRVLPIAAKVAQAW
jgi:putative DNA primase/helicase